MRINDNEGALKSYAWFEAQFPNDVGEPMQYLCWTLSLYRAGELEATTSKLRQTMLFNLYIIPHLIDQEQEERISGMGRIVQKRHILSTYQPRCLNCGMKQP